MEEPDASNTWTPLLALPIDQSGTALHTVSLKFPSVALAKTTHQSMAFLTPKDAAERRAKLVRTLHTTAS